MVYRWEQNEEESKWDLAMAKMLMHTYNAYRRRKLLPEDGGKYQYLGAAVGFEQIVKRTLKSISGEG